MSRRFAITGKSQHIRFRTILPHINQTGFQSLTNLLASRQFLLGTMIFIKTTFAINAIEGTKFTIFRKKIDS